MALVAFPVAPMSCGAWLALISLPLLLDLVWAEAPTQQVSNVRFVDTNSDGGWISGTIQWDPPADTTGIKNYAVLIFNSLSNVNPVLPSLPGDFMGAWYMCDLGGSPHAPVGTNDLTISTFFKEQTNFPRRGSVEVQPQTRRRYVWGAFIPPDRYLAVACVNEQKEAGPRVVIPIYDNSPLLPREHIGKINFADTNGILGLLDGKISWPPGIEGDFALTQSYSVYLANDDVGTNEMKVGESVVPTFELMLSSQARGQRDFIHIRAVNDNGISTWSKTVRLHDAGPSAPTEGVTALAFTDMDYTQGQVAGNITWTPPDDEAPISSYRIYLSNQQGLGGVALPSGGYEVPVGTNLFELPTYVIRGDPDYVQVFAINDKGMQASPAEIPIVDTMST